MLICIFDILKTFLDQINFSCRNVDSSLESWFHKTPLHWLLRNWLSAEERQVEKLWQRHSSNLVTETFMKYRRSNWPGTWTNFCAINSLFCRQYTGYSFTYVPMLSSINFVSKYATENMKSANVFSKSPFTESVSSSWQVTLNSSSKLDFCW